MSFSNKLKQVSFLCTGLSILTMTSASFANDEMPSKEEMWKIIQKQQEQINTLLSRVETTEKKVETTAEAVETASVSGSAPGWWNRTSLGGYGEMHYNALKDDADDEVDFHRFVLFVNHDFNERIRLFSELELEHSISGEGQVGEIELEQAFIEFDLNEEQTQHAKVGQSLIPVGIMNEKHEPATFYGVERNPVENNIVPSTWWEGGVVFNGQLPAEGFSYDVGFHSGLNVPTTGGSAFKIRNGRQKVGKADADKGAMTGRLKWTGYPGVELGTTVQYQQDVTQDEISEAVPATLWEAHADIERDGFGLRALYAQWDLDGAAPEAFGREEQFGWYVEPSYKFETSLGEVGFFARYNEYDNEAGSDGADTKKKQTDVGMNYWPHKDVVLKADFQFNDNPGATPDDEILNLGVGFQF